jgi:hypothetical protein
MTKVATYLPLWKKEIVTLFYYWEWNFKKLVALFLIH